MRGMHPGVSLSVAMQAGLVKVAAAAVFRVLHEAAQAGGNQRQLDGLLAGLRRTIEMAEQGRVPQALRQLATQVLPQTAQPAALAVQHLTPDPEAAQLELAQAAAARSCAYLCCANLGGEGGPAAGQGVGSMRCR